MNCWHRICWGGGVNPLSTRAARVNAQTAAETRLIASLHKRIAGTVGRTVAAFVFSAGAAQMVADVSARGVVDTRQVCCLPDGLKVTDTRRPIAAVSEKGACNFEQVGTVIIVR